jgi:hypothetical protein
MGWSSPRASDRRGGSTASSIAAFDLEIISPAPHPYNDGKSYYRQADPSIRKAASRMQKAA